MKKLISIISVFVLSLLVFSGCKVEGGTEITGIEFIRDVFYVDYQVETALEYKVYPHTASGVYVSFELNDDYTLESYYNFSQGKIKVLNRKFTSMVVKAKASGFEDSCEVKLREYPETVRFAETDVVLDSGMVYAMDLLGTFSSTGEERSVKDGEFIYKVQSSDPTVIEVVSEEGLIVQSTGRRGNATVNIQIFNASGQEMNGLSSSIDFVISESIDTAYATLGNNLVVKDGMESIVEFNPGSLNKLNVRYFDENGFLVDLAKCEVYLSNDDVFEIIEDQTGIYLKVIDAIVGEPIEDGGAKVSKAVTVTIKSNRLMKNGEPLFIQCKLQVQFL